MANLTGELLIGGQWTPGDAGAFESHNPSTGKPLLRLNGATPAQVADAVSAARTAFASWRDVPLEEREAILRRYADVARDRGDEIADLIADEAGKPLWEARTEAAALAGKVAVTVDAMRQRRSSSSFDLDGATAATRYRPLGVTAVLGPFNFPMHLANGHIVPALLSGNTVVFKPSELTPLCGELLVRLFQEAGLPPGVLNLVQGGREVGEALADDDIDSLLFTGGAAAGLALHRRFAGRPEVMLALELGGNNPLVVDAVNDVDAAVLTTVQSAFLTAGQRCTCARRLILTAAAPADFTDQLAATMRRLRIGPPRDSPPPFMGPLITADAAAKVLAAQDDLIARGGSVIVPCERLSIGDAFLTPGLIDVTDAVREDEEIFGPLLQVVRVADLDTAIEEANDTRFGLAAGLLADDPAAYETFRGRVRAGIVNWNQQLTGASGQLPFGGVGLSGNFRPSGAAAVDYCSHVAAGLENETLTPPKVVGLA